MKPMYLLLNFGGQYIGTIIPILTLQTIKLNVSNVQRKEITYI
jgi:hypothetical protein